MSSASASTRSSTSASTGSSTNAGAGGNPGNPPSGTPDATPPVNDTNPSQQASSSAESKLDSTMRDDRRQPRSAHLDMEQTEQESVAETTSNPQEKSQPHARPVNLVNYVGKGSERDFLAGNPFVPFAVAVSLGAIAAGGIKAAALFFRQLR